MEEAIVKCSNWDIKNKKFIFVGNSYLHGEAQDINGFDCIEGNLSFLRKLVRNNIFKASLLLKNKKLVDVIVIPWFNNYGITSLICLCSDREHIFHALFKYDCLSSSKRINTCIEETEKKYLYETYPHIKELIREYNLKY